MIKTMRITLFGKKDENSLPRHIMGKARPIAWAEGYSHVALRQEKTKPVNSCLPRWSCDANDMKELKEKLSEVSLEPIGYWDFSEIPKRKYTKRKKEEVPEEPQLEIDTAS